MAKENQKTKKVKSSSKLDNFDGDRTLSYDRDLFPTTSGSENQNDDTSFEEEATRFDLTIPELAKEMSKLKAGPIEPDNADTIIGSPIPSIIKDIAAGKKIPWDSADNEENQKLTAIYPTPFGQNEGSKFDKDHLDSNGSSEAAFELQNQAEQFETGHSAQSNSNSSSKTEVGETAFNSSTPNDDGVVDKLDKGSLKALLAEHQAVTGESSTEFSGDDTNINTKTTGNNYSQNWDDDSTQEPASAIKLNDDSQEEYVTLDQQWYVAIEDEQIGPIDLADLHSYWSQGRLNPANQCWQPGMDDWQPISEVEELRFLLNDELPSKEGIISAPADYKPSPFDEDEKNPGQDEIKWNPSAASELSSLVQDALSKPNNTPEDQANDLPIVNAPAPGIGGIDLFGAPPQTPANLAPISSPQQGNVGWSVPQPGSYSGIKPIYWILGALGSSLLIALVILLALNLRQSSTPSNPTTPIANPITDKTAVMHTNPKGKINSVSQQNQTSRKEVAQPKNLAKKRPSKTKNRIVKKSSKKSGKPSRGNSGLDDLFDSTQKSSKPAKEKLALSDIINGVRKMQTK